MSSNNKRNKSVLRRMMNYFCVCQKSSRINKEFSPQPIQNENSNSNRKENDENIHPNILQNNEITGNSNNNMIKNDSFYPKKNKVCIKTKYLLSSIEVL